MAAQRPPGSPDHPKPRPSAIGTAVLPVGNARQARTVVLQPAPVGDPVTPAGRPRRDSRQPLDFTRVKAIGRFGLIREIARGGMGQVFLARDTKLGRKVAIKFLLHDDPSFVSRFLVEARATARCTHDNIVTIFEVGEHAGLPFMVLEYLEGKPLSQLLEAKLAPRAVAELMVPIVRALERAHEHGIVHRDLKPSNVFVTDRGVVKVLDFGVAKCFDAPREQLDRQLHTQEQAAITAGDETYLTFSAEGSLVGTIPYMSPEQWGFGEVDALSDLWACGVMFWRAIVGVHPAGTMNPDKLRERLRDAATPLPSILQRDPTVPPELAAIIERCLAKPKPLRFQSATELLAALQAFLAPREAHDDESPYRGLAAFGEADAKFFFGRTAEIRTALGMLERWPLLAVIGPSGVGKSSFVHAGLVPAIRASGATPQQWQVRVLRPGRTPIASLAAALDPEYPSLVGQVTPQLADSPGALGEALRREAAYRGTRVLLVVDQLEELFTLSDDDTARRTFLAALLAAADDPSAPVRVVLSMRADFLDRLAGHKQFLGELSRGLYFLSAPDADHLRETIVRPAELAGVAFERPEIVEAMLQAATNRGALPLLQFAATQLWDARDRSRRLLTQAAYDAMGGVGGAVVRHADEVAAAVAPQQQPLLRAIMTRLVTPEGTRAVVDAAELRSLAQDSGDVSTILDHLVRGRLVHLHPDPDLGATVELVHEVLISEWPMLRRWLEDSHALRGFLHELQVAARTWAARGKPADLVWRGAMASDALALTSRHVLELAQGEREFLAAAKAQAARGRRRNLTIVTVVIAALGLVIAGGAVAYVRVAAAEQVATDQANEARKAEAKSAQQLRDLRAATDEKDKAEAARTAAQQAANQATVLVGQTHDELQRTNADLAVALAAAQQDQQKATRAAAAAAQAAAQARQATEEALAAKAKLQTLLAAERDRVHQLEQEKRAIATGGLK